VHLIYIIYYMYFYFCYCVFHAGLCMAGYCCIGIANNGTDNYFFIIIILHWVYRQDDFSAGCNPIWFWEKDHLGRS
jgi:hypothetical protein